MRNDATKQPFEAATSWDKLNQRLRDTYEEEHTPIAQIAIFEHLYGSIFSLKDKRVLDLGCGSESSIGKTILMFRPWLCRILYEVGARPVGIDIGSNKNEHFEHYKRNLLRKRSLSFLDDESFHTVNNQGFLPPLNTPGFLGYASPRLLKMIKSSRLEMFQTFLLSEAERLLQDGGYYVCHDTLYVKQNGHLCDKGKAKEYPAHTSYDIHNLDKLLDTAIFNIKPRSV